ncbi:hypothetical protein AAHA92_17055 [Salvia divinorum]|uniref:Uncharacterized protein n=1 Tax=Salvia divinorum TaxID=28513 RepID=A0ABD1GXI8_SALDI
MTEPELVDDDEAGTGRWCRFQRRMGRQGGVQVCNSPLFLDSTIVSRSEELRSSNFFCRCSKGFSKWLRNVEVPKHHRGSKKVRSMQYNYYTTATMKALNICTIGCKCNECRSIRDQTNNWENDTAAEGGSISSFLTSISSSISNSSASAVPRSAYGG